MSSLLDRMLVLARGAKAIPKAPKADPDEREHRMHDMHTNRTKSVLTHQPYGLDGYRLTDHGDERTPEEALHIDSHKRAVECVYTYDGTTMLLQLPKDLRTQFAQALLDGCSKFLPNSSIPDTWRYMVKNPDEYDEIAQWVMGL